MRTITRRLLSPAAILALLGIAVVAGLTRIKLDSALTASSSSCPPILSPGEGVETVFDTASHAVTLYRFTEDAKSDVWRIELDQARPDCGPDFATFLASLRKREAQAHAVTCGQKDAYLTGSLSPSGPLGKALDYDAQTVQQVRESYERECLPSAFQEAHWGISLNEAKTGTPLPR